MKRCLLFLGGCLLLVALAGAAGFNWDEWRIKTDRQIAHVDGHAHELLDKVAKLESELYTSRTEISVLRTSAEHHAKQIKALNDWAKLIVDWMNGTKTADEQFRLKMQSRFKRVAY